MPYWASSGAELHVNGEPQKLDPRPSTYARIERNWKAGDKITVTIPMRRDIAAAMYGPLVLAVRLGTDGLTTSMIYTGGGPQSSERYPFPVVEGISGKANAAAEEPWFAR